MTNFTLLLLINVLTRIDGSLSAVAIVLAIPPLTIGLIAGTERRPSGPARDPATGR